MLPCMWNIKKERQINDLLRIVIDKPTIWSHNAPRLQQFQQGVTGKSVTAASPSAVGFLAVTRG